MVAFLILREARVVLRSLYDRTPFTADNPRRLKRIAWYWLAGWLTYCALSVVMTLYLQAQLAVSGAELGLVPLPVLGPLIVAGLLIVLSEVFRVGFELKSENALTV